MRYNQELESLNYLLTCDATYRRSANLFARKLIIRYKL